MGSTDSERFDVYYRGECHDGADATAVRSALARLFRADEATLDRLFSGKLQRIKRGVDRPTAEKYRAAMEAAGARPIITAEGNAAPADPSPAQQPAPAAAPAQADPDTTTRDYELAPVGGDILRPDERPGHDAPSPATDHFDLAAVGETLGIATPPAPAVPAPDFDLAEVGAELASVAPRAAPATPDTSAITLAAPEHDLSDCARPGPGTPPPAVDHLEMAAPGGDLIDENERDKAQAVVPSTDHLSLADDVDSSGDSDNGDADASSAGNSFDRR